LYSGEVKFTIAHDVLWFVENKALTIGRIDIFNLINEEVPTHQIKEVFGYNEWYKYDKKVSVEVDKSTVELYIKVIRNQKPTNKSTKA
jgi:hypothetical protein